MLCSHGADLPSRTWSRAPWRRLVACALAWALPRACAAAAPPAAPWVTVREHGVVRNLQAYGRVEPIAVLRLRADEDGVLHGLRVVPGSAVRAGEVLARIGGPDVRAQRIADTQALRAAQSREAAARHELRSLRRRFALQLATAQAVDAAQAGLDAARAARRSAEARLHALQERGVLRAPMAASVLEVGAADGERVERGRRVVTLQPAGRLWLRAEYYGTDAARLRPGMTGRFRPAGGVADRGADAAGLAVRIVAMAPELAADGGERVELLPVASATPTWWAHGRWGELTLQQAPQRMVMVPTRALVLDRARWWVLVHTASGDVARQVVPGPVQGWRTAIVSGLRAGEQVVVGDAFLEYHRGIAGSYAPPD